MLARPALADATAIQVGGTGAALGLMRQLGARHEAEGGAHSIVRPSLGSAGALRALADGHIDIAVGIVRQPVSGPAMVTLGRTPICAACHASRPPTDLTGEQLAALLLAEQRRWPDGSPVRLVLRPSNDSEVQPLADGPPALRRAAPGPADRRGLPIATTSQDNASMLASLPGSLGLIGLAQFISEELPLRLIAVDGERPSVASLHAGRWPLAITLAAVGQPQARPQVQALLDFLAAPSAAPLLESMGVLTPHPQGNRA